MKHPIQRALSLLLSLGVLAGCSQAPEPTSDETASSPTPPQLQAVFGSVPAPESLSSIPVLRTEAKPGDTVTFEAKVMGALHPFVDGRSAMIVGDEGTVTSCDLLGDDDHCSTPWDACCEDPDLKQAGTVTVQVVNEEGDVLRHGIKGVSGLKELSRLRIRGTVAPTATEAAFVVNAEKIEIL